jgi:ArsR family transcriptional regulator, arsenate/arsenite/antimonite-responsive transcriptional repressor
MNVRTRPVQCCAAPSPPVAVADDMRSHWQKAFRALGDATRLEIFLLVAGQEAPLCACDVGSRFDLSQPTISHHMKTLAEAGLITVSRQGIWAYYELSDQGRRVLHGMMAASAPEPEMAPAGR